jgi:biopolymer transport protein ExbD
MPGSSRAKHAREMRRVKQFAKFKLHTLNLVPLIDAFVSIVFFTLVTATAGEMAPVATGVNLPEAKVGELALQQVTLSISSAPAQISLNGERLMSVQEAASAASNQPNQPLLIPALFSALKTAADSIRDAEGLPGNQSVDELLAIQGDRSMRYDLLSRVMQTARLAGFRNVTLQVLRADGAASTPTQASR